MSEPIAGVGYLAGICAHDGTDWQKLKIDAEGRLEVSVVAGHEYVDRGDPAVVDYDQTKLTIDDAWHDLDLSGIITDDDAVLVHILAIIKDDVTGSVLNMRKNGNTNALNISAVRTQAVNVYMDNEFSVSLDDNLVIEYNITTGMDEVLLIIRGWWRPAA